MVTIFYWRKELVRVDLSNTFSMVMKSIENFLETLQKKFYLQKYYHPSQLWLNLARRDTWKFLIPIETPDVILVRLIKNLWNLDFWGTLLIQSSHPIIWNSLSKIRDFFFQKICLTFLLFWYGILDISTSPWTWKSADTPSFGWSDSRILERLLDKYMVTNKCEPSPLGVGRATWH